MTSIRARVFSTLSYYDPREVLVDLRRQAPEIARRTDLADAVKQMRTRDLKPLRELRDACLFCYGWNQINGLSVRVAQVEGQDYDAVASYPTNEGHHFAPLQIKEVVPASLNQQSSVQGIVDQLTKYSNSEDLTVVIRLNRDTPFTPANLVVPTLKIAALWVFGALNTEQSRWAIWGNFLETAQCGEFSYPQ